MKLITWRGYEDPPSREPLPYIEDSSEDLYPDWSPAGRRQRGVASEGDQGDYATLFEHLLPKPSKYPQSSSYGSVLRSAARAAEASNSRPDESDESFEQSNFMRPSALPRPDESDESFEQSNFMRPSALPRRGESFEQSNFMRPDIGQQAALVTGQTPSIIQDLISRQRRSVETTRGPYQGEPIETVRGPSREAYEQAQPAPRRSLIPRTAREAYEQAQAASAERQRRIDEEVANLRARMSERQRLVDEKVSDLRSRLGARPSVMRATSGTIQIDRSSPEAFLGSLRPAAEEALAARGLPSSLAPILAAIPMNEQGWQREAPGHNYYGIKGKNPRTGASQVSQTWEAGSQGRVDTQAEFRAYDSPSESVGDFIQFLESNPRYSGALEIARKTGDPEQFIRAVHAAGYATDPQWADKVLAIARRVPTGEQRVAMALNDGGEGIGSQVASNTTVRQQQQMASSGASVWEAGKLTPNQITEGMAQGLDKETAYAICGPAAAIAFARKTGKNPTLPQALELAKQVGWTLENGMAGPASQLKLLQKMGIPALLEEGAPDANKVVGVVQAGSPVIISTPGHYFVAERYDPRTGKFDFGESAKVLKAANQNSWFTLDEIRSLGMGAPRAALYLGT